MGKQGKTSGEAQHVRSAVGLNQSVIIGELVQLPEQRVLPSGDTVANFSLTVRSETAKTTSVPLVWFDPPTRVQRWAAGASVVAVGAVVRRFYRGAGGLGSSTEIVVSRAELVRQRTRVQSAIAAAMVGPADVLSLVELVADTSDG